ncbi:immunoglobulin lambda-1 light chain-like isoform X16 [Sceloporus undulatus]|uniref:immunoglobulin lambda-1 light chain-like isoform X16 n=1 Tax=Sceloporus undulatus TaxID=8520 RepID=UPI001C4C858D|nr:immunoglobulin lambda-1 light chain-like isoform X16 [Sceloporus undulatus]
MAQALLLFTILASVGPSVQQLQTLKDPESVALGGTVTMSCRFNSGTIGDGNYPWWAQQKSGMKPRAVMHSTSTRPSDVPDRFSGSRAGNVMSLTITRAQMEDEAVYYCCVWSGSEFVFGGGTHLTVTGQNPVHPSVFLFPPSQEEIKTKSKATLVCLMDEFHPGVIQVEWKADGTTISSGVETTKPLKQGNKYVASSYLTLSESDWKSHNKYACKVTHESKTIEKEVNRSECS